jgi:archaellum biogenesis protein FlaJ (TadC family)
VFFIILFTLLGLFSIWLPCILITGFNYSEAFVYSVSLMSDHRRSIVASILLPYLICTAVALIATFIIGNTAGFIVLIAAFLIYFIYYTSLMYVIYFYLTKEKREDLKKNIFKR